MSFAPARYSSSYSNILIFCGKRCRLACRLGHLIQKSPDRSPFPNLQFKQQLQAMTAVPVPPSAKLVLPGTANEEIFTLCPFPSVTSGPSDAAATSGGSVALYGNDDGIIYLLPPNTATSSSSNAEQQQQPTIVRKFDEPIQSLAVSSDGRRVAVGFEGGTTQIFAYDDYELTSDDAAAKTQTHHPFLCSSSSSTTNGGDDGMAGMDDDDDDDDDDDGFGDMLSQDVDSPTKSSPSLGQEFSGPRFEAPVRSLAFLPLSTSGGKKPTYYLAVGTESSQSFCVIDVTSADTILSGGQLLRQEAENAHDSGGVRSVAVGNGIVATLGLDGRLCTWSTPQGSDSDPAIDWEEAHRDSFKAVPNPDIGFLNGSQLSDRATGIALGGQNQSWLAIAGRSDVQLRHVTDDFKKERFLFSSSTDTGTVQGHSDTMICLAFSPDGSYLASSGMDGRIVIWSLNKDWNDANDDAPIGTFVCQLPRESVATLSSSSSTAMVTSMLWTDDTLRVAGSDGSLTILPQMGSYVSAAAKAAEEAAKQTSGETSSSNDDAVDSTSNEIDDILPETQPPEVTADIDSGSSKKGRLSKKAAAADSDSDDDVDFAAAGGDDDDDATVDKAAPPMAKNSNRFVDDEAEDDDDDADAAGAAKDQDSANIAGKDQDRPADEIAADGFGDNLDDDGDFPIAADDDHDATDIQRYDGRRAVMDVPEMQPAFAPSSTPLSTSTTRIMCWNHVGTLTIRDEGVNNTVDINFVDGAFRRPITFTDNLNFVVGSLGEDGGIFASDVTDDDMDDGDDMNDIVDGLNMSDATKRILKRSNRKKRKGGDDNPKGSSVYFHRFETFGALKDKDWVVTLPDGEMALGCACGEGWAAVATSRRFLRLFSSGGNQGAVSWLKGDLVTMVGRGRFLAVLYHENTPMPDGTQNIGYRLLDATTGCLITTGSVSAISTGATLTWAGFSNDYSLMVMDSDGMLSMLASETGIGGTGGGWEWSPMLDTLGLRKSNDDSFWPVSCMDGKLVCVPLKGGNEHPDAVRRPVTTALGFRLPLARGILSKNSVLEDLQVRADLSLKQKKFLNDTIAPNDEDLMDEYDQMCANVDKITLKFLFEILKSGKLERALDLVERLHLEKSFDIAIKASDRMNFLKLSDRIEAARDSRFPPEPLEEEEDDVDRRYFAQRQYTDGIEDDRGAADDESVQSSTAITPDSNRRGGTKRGREELYSDIEEEDEDDIEEERPAPKRKLNPFAKKKLESPSKFSSPIMSPSSKPKLSRTSTFSAQARSKTKGQKRIL